jgi:peroxiredoxin
MVILLPLIFWCIFAPEIAQAAVPTPAPALELIDLYGQEQAINDFQGKLTLVHFWATWCATCREELPDLLQLQQMVNPAHMQIIMVAADSHDAVRDYMTKYQLTMRVLIDQYGAALREYGVRALPVTYVIGRDGQIIRTFYGQVRWHSPEATQFLREQGAFD